MSLKFLALAVGLLAVAGCTVPVRQQVDALICDRAAHPTDIQPGPLPPHEPAELPPPRLQPEQKPNLVDRLKVPPGVPGGQTPDIKLPAGQPLEVLDQAVKQYFPPLPALGPEPTPQPGPEGRPLSLADLQRLARANSPLLRQAAADVEAAKGTALQAGLYPNPTIGTTGQTTGPGGGPFYGVTASQMIKTMGKLKLAQASAKMDLVNAELAYRRAETDLMAQVRGGYFSVLVARESMRANRSLVYLTDELYRVMVQQLRGGVDVAPYEPMQLGALAAQARASLLTARNAYQLSWRQLASALGLPALPLTEVEGRADMPIPRFDYQKTLARVLSTHTDVQTTSYGIEKARYNLRLAQVTAYPDVSVQAIVQQDATPPNSGPNRVISTLGMSVPVPLFDRNQGGIQQAQGSLVRAVEEPHRVRSDLTARVTEAFRRYDENRALLELYRTEILPKQVHAFRAVVKRHWGGEPEKVSYLDIVQAEQNLLNFVATYLTILGAQWQAVVDVGSFLQTDDLFEHAEGTYPAALPDLEQLLQLPCCHPCTPPVPGAPADLNWISSERTLGQAALPVEETQKKQAPPNPPPPETAPPNPPPVQGTEAPRMLSAPALPASGDVLWTAPGTSRMN
jgi:cobalt-zinc-cadmium efflux system outer membrane protein